MTYESNKKEGTITASTIYPTEEVAMVDYTSATDKGASKTEGMLRETPL